MTNLPTKNSHEVGKLYVQVRRSEITFLRDRGEPPLDVNLGDVVLFLRETHDFLGFSKYVLYSVKHQATFQTSQGLFDSHFTKL